MTEPLDPLRTGAALFDQGEFWRAHECWEELWRAHQGDSRDFLKGLIQLAGVNFHLERGNLRGARRLIDTSARHLAGEHAAAWSFDATPVLAATSSVAAKIDAGIPVEPLALGLSEKLRV